MKIHLNPPPFSPTTKTEDISSVQSFHTSTAYNSSLRSDNETFVQKVKGYFWKGVDYLKVMGQWIVWVFYCFPHEETPLEFVEDMIDKPAENAKVAVKDPDKTVAKFIIAALENPGKIEGLKEDKTKGEALGTFIRTFKGNLKDTKLFSDPKRFLKALKDFYYFKFTNKEDIYDAFLNVFRDNVSLLSAALLKTCEDAMAFLGNEETENLKLKALKHTFGITLPHIANQNPEFLKKLFDKLKASDALNPVVLLDYLDELPDFEGENRDALTMCLRNDAILIRYLLDPPTHFDSELDIDGARMEPFDFRVVLFQNLIKLMTPEHVANIIATMEKEKVSPLAITLVKEFKEIAKNKESMEKIGENLSKSIEFLESIYLDYKAFPVKK